MKVFVLLCLFGASLAATVVDPKSCTEFPCLIFEDEFDTLDHDVWEHEITAGGGGNGEFQAYVNNRSISYVRDSTLFIKPTLTTDWQPSPDYLTTGTMSLWGAQGRNDICTANFNYGCEQHGSADNPLKPLLSARLRSLQGFSFRYGTVEMRAKSARGDWLWPAMWMMPENFPYGAWPASGEIDIMECRGNAEFGQIGSNASGSTLHWGPYYTLNSFPLTTSTYYLEDGALFPDDFHVWKLEWTDVDMKFYLDDVLVLTIDPTSFWELGGFDDIGDLDNIWKTGGKMAPFDQKFYFTLNLAVGGTGGYFPDGISDTKPWSDTSSTPVVDFLNDMDTWLPTWQQGEGKISEGAALQVDYIRVYKMTSPEM